MNEKYQLNTKRSFLCGITSDDSNYNVTFSNIQVVDLLNKWYGEVEKLKQIIDDLTSEFEGYHKSLEETKDYDKQFEVTSCPYEIRNNKSMDYYWLEHQGNVIGICNVLNEQSNKIMELQKQNEKLKRLNGKQQLEIEILSEELAQCKAVIDKRWHEYLEEKERGIDND